MQRRPHHKITPKEELIDFLHKLDKKIDFNTLKNNEVSKITKGGFCAIIDKKNDKYVLITIRGYRNIDLDTIKLYVVDSHTAVNGSFGTLVLRKNFKGKMVKCGYVGDIYGSDNEKLLCLSPKLKKKYIGLEFNRAGIKFVMNEEVENLITFDKQKGLYILNEFEHVIYK
jgi:hypothetical protein